MLVKAAGAKSPEGFVLDGFDMLPVLQGKHESPRKEIFWQRRNDRAACVDKWKWVGSRRGGGLFDLSTDVGEKQDLSEEKPDVLKMIQSRFAAWSKSMEKAEPRGPFCDY